MLNVSVQKLSICETNVRKGDFPAKNLKPLMASIETYGLLNNLVVKQSIENPENYLVVAGGRRYQAICELIDAGKFPQDYTIPCQVIDADEEAVSLSENIIRSDMHPLDEFEAFANLNTQGLSKQDIAVRFGVSEYFVRQRLRLGQVAEPIRQALRAELKFDIQLLIAFTVTKDQNKQLEVFNTLNPKQS